MRWWNPWGRKEPDVVELPEKDWKSPFDADVIGPGDPGWEIFQAAMEGPVIGTYDATTGEVVSIERLDEK